MMAQRIQTVCDVHAERGEDVDATTWEVLARKAGSRVQVREVDLCDECAQVLTSVAAFAAENGRTVQQATPKVRPAVPAPTRTVAASTDTTAKGKVSCPLDDCGSVVNSTNLARHVRKVHGLELADVGGRQDLPAEHPCPDCDRTFTRAQALGAHRYQAHGYVSPTRADRAERAERAAIAS